MNGAYSGVQIGKGKEAFSSFTAHTRFPLLKKRKCMAWRIRHFWDSRHSSKVRRDDETGNKKGKEGNTVFFPSKDFSPSFRQTEGGKEKSLEIGENARKREEINFRSGNIRRNRKKKIQERKMARNNYCQGQ